MESAKWVFGWIGRQRWRVVVSCVLLLLGVGLMMVEPFIFKSIVDDVIMKGEYERLLPLLLAALGFVLANLTVKYVNTIFWEISSQEIVYGLRSELFKRIMAQPQKFFRENTSGDLITKCTGDVDMVRHFICWVIPSAVESAFMIITVLVIFLAISPVYALCLFVLTPITAILAYLLGRKIRPAHNEVREQRAALSTVVNENISGTRVVKAFVREDFEMNKFMKENHGYRDSQLKVNAVWLKYNPFIEGVSQVLNAVNLVVGGVLVILTPLTLGEMQIFMALAWALNQPMINMSMIINDAQRFFAACEKLMYLYYRHNDIASPEKPAKVDEVRGGIRFDDVSLTLNGAKILHGIDLEIKPGQTVGFMGPTGSGKTMLASLIPRFADVSRGSVTVDGIDVRKYELTQLRGAVGLTMQDVFLFSASVENNVAYGKPDAPIEEIVAASVAADADSFVSKMQEGYSTIVGERGTGLSGGQKQRISLARALLPSPPILILDDTTSAVDMETEQYIQAQLKALPKRSTTLIIAQRVSSIKHADMIYIMDGGRIAERGTHDELMKLKGYYYETCILQQGSVA
ncbi:ABC transporter ATP-binding protein [Clostridia bacterium]|nr:ABC transporter ATP-binding protein [Clostridia bacterium]